MATIDKKNRKNGKRKPTEEVLVEDSTSSKRKKHHVETAAVDKKKTVKQKPTEKSISSSKRKKWSHAKASTSEVVTMDEEDLDKHTHLLSSVTGKMERLPLYEEGQVEKEEGRSVECAAVVGEEENKGVCKGAAAQYLVLWNSQRDKWTFKKKTQYWLLQNMFDKKKVSKANFKLLLLYLDGLHGNQRGLAKERAEKVAAHNESDKDKVSESKIKYKRACKVLNILAKSD